MIPSLAVSVDGGAPVIVSPTTNALWLAEETVGSLSSAGRWPLLLTLAYYAVAGEPDAAVTIDTVRAWARDNQIRVDDAPEPPDDPTQARSTGP